MMSFMQTQESQTPLLSEKFRLMHGLLTKAQGVLLVTHMHPDSDGVGSLLALHQALKHFGIRSFPFVPDLPDHLRFLPGVREIQSTAPQEIIDCVVALDYGDVRRLPVPRHFLSPPYTLITLDHHLEGKQEGTLCIVEPSSAATASLVFQYFKTLNLPIEPEVATCLLAGIFGDTGGFRHTNTSAEILSIAAELFSRGASIFSIAQAVAPKRTSGGMRLWAQALGRIGFEEDVALLHSHLLHEEIASSGAELEELFGFVSFLNAVPEARVAAFFIEREPKRMKGELRTEPYKGVDVAAIASELGGGGHKLAAGFESSKTVEEIVGTVQECIRRQIALSQKDAEPYAELR